jgi:hypothetical protein
LREGALRCRKSKAIQIAAEEVRNASHPAWDATRVLEMAGVVGMARLFFPLHQVAEIVLYLCRVVPHLPGSPSATHLALPAMQLCPPGKTGFVPQMRLGHPHLRLQSQHVLWVWKLGRIHVFTRFLFPLPLSRFCKRRLSTLRASTSVLPVCYNCRRREGRRILLLQPKLDE